MAEKRNKGFTLAELLVVILIVGVLAALGLPQFMKTKEKALGKEAISNLKLIAAAQKIYRLEEDSRYYPIPAGTQSDISEINDYLRLFLPTGSSRNWNYSVTSIGSPTGNFTSTATRTSGINASCTYWINNTLDDPLTTTCP